MLNGACKFSTVIFEKNVRAVLPFPIHHIFRSLHVFDVEIVRDDARRSADYLHIANQRKIAAHSPINVAITTTT